MPSSPPPILVAALALLATRALVILASYAAYLRWRARRTLKALLCAAGLGRAEGDAAAPDPADDEPEPQRMPSMPLVLGRVAAYHVVEQSAAEEARAVA